MVKLFLNSLVFCKKVIGLLMEHEPQGLVNEMN